MSVSKRFVSMVASVLFLFVADEVASAAVSVVNGPNGATSIGIWYLGPTVASCCTGLANLYWASSTASLTNNSGDPNPTIYWYTDTPNSLNITPSSGSKSVSLTALAPSPTRSAYDIHLWAIVDGVQSTKLAIYIDTPYSVSYSAPIASPYGCYGIGDPPTWVGYVMQVTNSIIDWTGTLTLTKIDTNETLENKKLLQSPTTWGYPAAGVWYAAYPSSRWATNTTFIDTLSECGTPGNIPQMVNYNPGSNTPGFSTTQKLWVGSPNFAYGECVEIDAITEFTGFASQTKQLTPGSTPTQQVACAAGHSIEN